MASSLSNLVDNLAERIHKSEGKDCNCFLQYKSVNDNLIKYKCFSSNKNDSNKIDEKLKSDSGIHNNNNRFILLLKGVRDEWEIQRRVGKV